MDGSILNTVKRHLNIDPSYNVFDETVLMHINTALATLTQLGVGPAEGFAVEDATATWSDFLGDDLVLRSASSYVSLCCRMAFDPPSTGFHVTAMKEQIAQLEWRLNVQIEGKKTA